MPRPMMIDRPVKVTFNIPEAVLVRLKLFLVSPSLGKAPHGALSEFLTARTVEYLDRMAAPSSTSE